MKATVSGRTYLPLFLLFTFVFVCFFLLFLVLGRMAFPPSKAQASAPSKSETPVVVIDPGHGGEDGGAVGAGGVLEKDVNLAIAKELCDFLKAQGISAVLTRTEDILLYDPNSDYHGQKKVQDLSTRKRIAESYGSAVFVSIHMNAFPDPKYGGLQVYYSENHPASKRLAEEIQALTRDVLLPRNHRKIKPSDGNLYLLDRLHCPSVLVECGFLSNPEDLAALSDPIYRRKMALVLCRSISEYLKKEASVS